ncbi:CobW family GTP-binding protein [Cohaesibacter celericrescens]|uniref:GTP-binding protein n=1 Tax=Cohaesibacter celericrescens TaxID=2067669 RepID=A0A2N5XRM1_9HYPH|nr:GTP-binding protein [Cohaesibacter celericrescens]PLW77163.1 GTP-binding protein [Cohaesibacter celericrescens]
MDSSAANQATPISLLTGFLGSGKTTVLNYLLQQPDLARTAVIINEFGAIGLDHELVEATTENMVLLQSGCLCCTIRGDLVETLHDLMERKDQAGFLAFDRVFIETTGLADPAPILHTLITDKVLKHAFYLDGVITTIDAASGSQTLDAQEEAVKQAAVADRLVLTKTDLVDAQTIQTLETRLRDLNPSAPILRAHNGALDTASILNAGFDNLANKSVDVQNWLNAEAYQDLKQQHHEKGGHNHDHHCHGHDHHHDDHEHDHDHDPNRHDDRITAVSYSLDEPISAAKFESWLEKLVLACGPDLLRLKAIVHVEGVPKPFVIHGVQHIFHPPMPLMDWPENDRQSRIVVIGRDISNDFLKESFGILDLASSLATADGQHQEPAQIKHQRGIVT